MNLDPTAPLVEALRAAGLRLTPQRLAIVQCLAVDETHPTAQELYERLHARFPTMSVATVYNTLSALGSIGSCRQLDMGGPSRFDPNVAPHDHAVCERCGAIRDVDLEPGPDRARRLAGFRVARVERIYRGLCAACTHVSTDAD
jgi:Fur family peroxide stress response transcriptional regulator